MPFVIIDIAWVTTFIQGSISINAQSKLSNSVISDVMNEEGESYRGKRDVMARVLMAEIFGLDGVTKEVTVEIPALVVTGVEEKREDEGGLGGDRVGVEKINL
jgi:hypothetical protein